MSLVPFTSMPDEGRLWVFGAAEPLDPAAATRLLEAVDHHLAQWRAHGTPLVAAREWREDRFLAVAVDEAATGASGCSIDGMFRVLSALENEIGTSLVGAGRVFWRDHTGAIHTGSRQDFSAAARRGDVTAHTMVFDPSITTVGEWRRSFEKRAESSWHARLVAA
jgi:hypothetical protein